MAMSIVSTDNHWNEPLPLLSFNNENELKGFPTNSTGFAKTSQNDANRHHNPKKCLSFALDQSEIFYTHWYIGKKRSRDLWYSRDELDTMKVSNLRVATGLKNGQFSEGNEYTSHGLEYLNIIDGRRRSRIKCNAFDAVMEEQQNQYMIIDYNPFKIAKAYRDNGAEESQRDAYERGRLNSNHR